MTEQEDSKITSRALAALEERFPHDADLTQKLARESETFREICADFVECSEILERLAELGAKAEARIQEYTDFKAQLEHELLDYLEGRSRCQGSAGKGEEGSDTRSYRSKDSNNRR